MKDVCNFIAQSAPEKPMQFIHFVYETGVKKLAQPFCNPYFRIHLADRGSAVFTSGITKTTLKKGDLFFTFPQQRYTIDAQTDFSFLYISFSGKEATEILKNLNIDENRFRFAGFEHVLQFWMDSIIRMHPGNAYLVAQSVLTHTLSHIADVETATIHKEKIDLVLEYVNHNYATKDMSLKKVAGIFFYNEKYLSALFARKTGVRFSQYVNELRISRAKKRISEGETNISVLADQCGFSDAFYFSKVFKNASGQSPNQYIKTRHN